MPIEFESPYESRFYYIDNDVLRMHMADALEFIANLTSIADKFPEQSKNYFYKACILYTASLIESHINHCLIKFWFTEIHSKERIYSSTKTTKVVDINWESVEIMTCKRERKKISLSWNIDFNLLIEFAKKEWIIDEEMRAKLHKIRKKRNDIHLMKLENIDRWCSKQYLEKVFSVARSFFKLIEYKIQQ